MVAEAHIAVAGSGKTASIASRIKELDEGARSLAITYTLNGQREISVRLGGAALPLHETSGWYSFLLNHMVKPYLPSKFRGIDANGLNFVNSDQEIAKYRKGWAYYFDDSHRPYSSRLAMLSKHVLNASDGAPIKRLQDIYSHIYIDEVQDLGGNDLAILHALMKSSIQLFFTGDVRQAVLTTSRSDRLNSVYRGANLVKWFREREDEGLCAIEYIETSRRFIGVIAKFSDLIHDPALGLPQTTSQYTETTNHDGVFLVSEQDLDAYVTAWKPLIMHSRTSPRTYPKAELLTFGTAKGLTRNRVVIMTTGPIRDWLTARKRLADSSAAGFYVAATRGRHSVALVVPNAEAMAKSLHGDFAGIVTRWVPPE
jgi:DNA helicase-2/ATP-dependent DNA helicase PcrA